MDGECCLLPHLTCKSDLGLKQLQAITNYQMNPHIVIILDEEESVLVEEIKQLRMDPTTGRTYERFDKVNADKLTMNNSTDEEVKALAAEFK